MSLCQVLCNGGVATQLSLIYLVDVGSADLPIIDFDTNYRASQLGCAVLGALACCSGDTWASEIGSVWSKQSPRLITTFQRVPRGTNGAVSLAGLTASVIGGTVVGAAFYLGVLWGGFSCATPQGWRLLLLGSVSGLIGSLLDSFLGATLQFSGVEESTGAIVEEPGPGIKRIPMTGLPILDNHGVNLASSIITALLTPWIALHFL